MKSGTQPEPESHERETHSALNSTGSTLGNERDNQSKIKTPSGVDYTELKYRDPANVSLAKLSKGLGVFSIALGLAEVLAPARIGEMIGVGDRYRTFLPLLGVREIAHGIGILSQTKPTESVWSRVAGDAIDLAFLGAAFAGEENNKARLTGATVAVLGVTALDIMCATALSKQDWSDADGNQTAPTTVGQSSARQSV